MWQGIVAVVLTVALPAFAWAGPLRDAADRAARELAAGQQQTPEPDGRSRLWTGIVLIAAGGVLAALGAVELGDDEDGPDDGEDDDESDDGEDSDGSGKVLLGGGVAAAAVGGIVLLTGGGDSGPRASLRSAGVAVRHTIRF